MTDSSDARPKVLRIITRLNLGGPARHVVILDDRLSRAGWNTLLVHGTIAAGEASVDQRASGPVRQIAQLGRRLRATDDLRALIALIRIVFEFRPDVIHTHTAKAGVLGRLAAAAYNALAPRQRRCVVVHTFHGHVLDGYFGPLANRLVRMTERAFGRITDAVVAISAQQRDELAARFRVVPTEKIRVIPLGLDLAPLLSLPPPLNEGKPVTFGYIGRFVEIKNLPLLLRAFARVRESGREARLVMAGGGVLQDDLMTLTRTLGVADSVEFVGWRFDLQRFYRTIDALVLTSRNEGTPVALIEAMAAALPVVATRVGGVPDVVRDAETGILTPPDDVDAIARALTRIADDRALRRRLGDAARCDVADRFQADRLVADVRSLYDDLIREVRPRPRFAPL